MSFTAPRLTRVRRRHVWLGAVLTLWLGGVGTGLWAVWAYDNRPGVAASAPQRWPTGSIGPASDRPTLVFLAHPQCSCTRASLDELAEILARVRVKPKTYVLFLKPAGMSDGWEQTDLWRRATELPGARVLRDDDGAQAHRFGVETSGETLLYDERGALVFSGGITGSRGHAGENESERALIALLNGAHADRQSTSVFGCPLFADAE